MLILTAPNGPPENFTGLAISSQNIHLYWDPPLRRLQNGFIVGYRVKVLETNTGHTSIKFVSTPAMSITLTSLHPYYTYSCTVAAMTTVGLGPYSTDIYITTFQDGKSSLHNIAYKCRLTMNCIIVHITQYLMELHRTFLLAQAHHFEHMQHGHLHLLKIRMASYWVTS